MANKGRNTNGSQFFITLYELPDLDGEYTIIGTVLNGLNSLQYLTRLCGSLSGETQCNLKITQTGIYNFDDYTSKNKNLKL
jgi:peptidylprolyl isomerase